MRIAHICQSYPPMVSGAALAAERLASSMVDRGHDVLVVAASERRRAYVDRNNGVSLVRVRSLRNPVRSGQCFSLLPLREVSAALRSFAPDLVHLHDPLCLGLCGLRAARVHHLPLVFTAHSLPQIVSRSLPDLPVLRQTVERMLWSYARWFAGQCDVVITPSQTAARALRARIGGDPLVIGNVVNRERFPASVRLCVRNTDSIPHCPLSSTLGASMSRNGSIWSFRQRPGPCILSRHSCSSSGMENGCPRSCGSVRIWR